MNWRKTFFILPNLFTLGNMFCGFFALALSAGATDVEQLYQAALAISFGLLFDLLDGRVARLTRTQTELGMQLDSLADVVTFGAAPAMLVYKWGLTRFGLWGIFIAFCFLAAGAMRLARFNVLEARQKARAVAAIGRAPPDERAPEQEASAPQLTKQRPEPEHQRAGKQGRQTAPPAGEEEDAQGAAYFLGLSIPAAASLIVSLVVVHHHVGGAFVVYSQSAIAALVLILSYLMVSRVRFRSFKDLRLTKRSLSVVFLLVVASVIITTRLSGSFVFLFLVSAYLTLGLTEEVYHFAAERRRHRRRAKLAAGEPLTAEDSEIEDDEEEVLRELGAEDTNG